LLLEGIRALSEPIGEELRRADEGVADRVSVCDGGMAAAWGGRSGREASVSTTIEGEERVRKPACDWCGDSEGRVRALELESIRTVPAVACGSSDRGDAKDQSVRIGMRAFYGDSNANAEQREGW
jgi:hypothetical protein